ncbi:MAG: esterase-like activity of phytase family protein [Kiritimatiellae bacterium]|nr:esterase-like activity of phytase family protein [Kiritimatiellia bacterium]
MAKLLFLISSLVFCSYLSAWEITFAGEYVRNKRLTSSKREGISSIAYLGGNSYFLMNDKFGILIKAEIEIDSSTGKITGLKKIGETKLLCQKDADHEGIVYDKYRKLLWVTEEKSNDIFAYDLVSCEKKDAIDIPDVYNGFFFNRSFESLTMSENGLEMWTCNESALNGQESKKDKRRFLGKPFNDTDDGAEASLKHGTVVRLQKFIRKDHSSKWQASEQYAYITEAISSRFPLKWQTCGVSELLLLSDGILLSLERKVQTNKIGIPTVCCEIYQIDLSDATDTSSIKSLSKANFTPVKKKLLFKKNTALAVYEGMCLGPKLDDGSQLLILVSDADQGAVAKILTLKIKK